MNFDPRVTVNISDESRYHGIKNYWSIGIDLENLISDKKDTNFFGKIHGCPEKYLSDFYPPVTIVSNEGIQKIVRKEGKFFFLLKLLPYDIWEIIFKYKFRMEKETYIDRIFDEELYFTSSFFTTLSKERIEEIMTREKPVRVTRPGPGLLHKSYYPKDSIYDKIIYDRDILSELWETSIRDRHNTGILIFKVVMKLYQVTKRWFFFLDRARFLLMGNNTRYNFEGRDLMEKSGNIITKICDDVYRLVTTKEERYSKILPPFEDNYFNTTLIQKKDLCHLILIDIKYLIHQYNYCLRNLDDPPDCFLDGCEKCCQDFHTYFYNIFDWKIKYNIIDKLDLQKVYDRRETNYYNRMWFEVNQKGEFLLWELLQSDYYNLY